jgi:hypothetical protein
MATGKVIGEVARIIPNYGFKLVETLKNRDGSDRKNWITVWTDAKVNEGDEVEVIGDISVKVESFTGRDNVPKQVAAMHLNNATVKTTNAPF